MTNPGAFITNNPTQLTTIMKLTCLLLSLSMAVASANSDYLNFLIQTQNDAAQTTHKLDDINPTGNATALQGIMGSSVFRLWTIHRSTGEEYLLDEKTVSAYHPTAEITIRTGDPYSVFPRTRVDQPFELTYSINGLLPNDPQAPVAAKSVIFDHTVTKYGPNKEIKDSTSINTTVQTPKSENKTTNETRMTSIIAADITAAKGEEMFTIWALPDGIVSEVTALDTAKVQIWPIATASITPHGGMTAPKTETRLSITLTDLYPYSTTYLRFCKGDPDNPHTTFTNVNTANVIINDTTPQDRQFEILNLNEFLTESGDYTVQIVHETPFGADILASHIVGMKTNITINAHMSDIE